MTTDPRARDHGLRVDDPAVLADTFSVQVHLRPAPVVAGSTWTATVRPGVERYLARRVAVAEHPAGTGLPAARCAGWTSRTSAAARPVGPGDAAPHRHAFGDQPDRDGDVRAFAAWIR